MKIVTADEMRKIEAAADKKGLSFSQMMENAGRAVALEVSQYLEESSLVLVLVGPGNNGGDGLVTARILKQELRANVTAYLLEPRAGTDSVYQATCDAGVPIFIAEDDREGKELKLLAERCDVVIDALYGIGARLPLPANATTVIERVRSVIERPLPRTDLHRPLSPLQMRRLRPAIIAVDCPSGLDCDTGKLDANVLPADVTVTFGAAKRGQVTPPGAEACGELVVADIRIPAGLAALDAVQCELIDGVAISETLPKRPRTGHKTTFGRALIIGGSKQYIGAPALAGKAAYRTGAGLVAMAVPQSVQGMLAGDFLEATWFPLPDERGYLGETGAEALRRSEIAYDAACLGVGLGWNDTTLTFMTRLLDDDAFLANVRHLVIDADGLNLLSEIVGWPAKIPPGTIITPHPGEMARLTGKKNAEIESNRIGIARQTAADWGCVTVLKGPYTVVASPDGRIGISPFATDALAKAGTGDVLTGILVGLLAGGMEPFKAAKAGVYLHAYTAMKRTSKQASRSFMAGELLDDLPSVLKDFEG